MYKSGLQILHMVIAAWNVSSFILLLITSLQSYVTSIRKEFWCYKMLETSHLFCSYSVYSSGKDLVLCGEYSRADPWLWKFMLEFYCRIFPRTSLSSEVLLECFLMEAAHQIILQSPQMQEKDTVTSM